MRCAVGVDEHVRRFQIAVHDAVRVRVLHCLGDPQGQFDAATNGYRTLLAPAIERFAAHQLHHQIQASVGESACVVHGRDRRMAQSSERLDLATESARVARRVGSDRRMTLIATGRSGFGWRAS